MVGAVSAQRARRVEQVVDQVGVLGALLHERDGLLTTLDRVATLYGTARLIREKVGVDIGFVADLDGPHQAVIRWLSGARTDSLQNLTVPVGQGIGGRVLALGRPVQVPDYVSSPTITHHFDAQVRGEGLAAMIGVPIMDDGKVIAIAYGALRQSAVFGDIAVGALEGVAAQAATSLRVARAADASRQKAVTAERDRMRNALHDSVGALLFSIGAQVRDLHEATRDNPVLGERLRNLEADISAASTALRESLLALSETSPERALPVELAEHCRSFESRCGVPARFVQLGHVPRLDAERAGILIAAVREGLLNVEKHAAAFSVVVSLSATNNGVQVVVADDGVGKSAEPVASTGLGLPALTDRAARLGGRVSLVRDDEGGRTLRVWLPHVDGGATGGPTSR